MGERAGGQRIPTEQFEDSRRRQESGQDGRRGHDQPKEEKGDKRRDEGGPGQEPHNVDPAEAAWSRNTNLSPPIHPIRPE